MRTETQEAVLSAYIASIGQRTPHEAAHDTTEICRLANSLNRLNEIACNCGLSERQEQRKQSYKNGSRRCSTAPAWSSTTLKVIHEATPCTSTCRTAPTTVSAVANTVTASGGEPCTTPLSLSTTPIGRHTGNPTEPSLICDSLIQPTAARSHG